ncbi:AbiTii domain-containing protein [Klebsiella pneumoniae]|uniref:AbiTii domain-containing protein n=1 Tax=Klebsiella pneumoniae complex TaxID=3390273 RepID=UPI0020CE4BD9|nr:MULTISPECIES: hypothetical protein [Klebsiella]HBR1222460.1 hypothetical protein [Klebsiella quasipneumoniae subsp. similipneumoniae]MCQ0788415.1 hypothetical protein [Klebsiella pneumoniae]MDW1477950.1 hypothetical protein [Klebsiella pneumoniae]HCA9995076.1 hypothetical protein [Klebsiella pneumoniae]HCD4400696.1 hypothetical protein [Klebsiella pneumoniae]
MALVRFEHELELAKELLDDIELSRLNAEALFLKATRLARLCGSAEFQKWVGFEIRGYVSDDETALKYMSKTGRWTDRKEMKGYWAPIAQIEAVINSQKLKLNSLSTPNISGVSAAIAIMQSHHQIINNVSNSISTYTGIKSRALGILHDFVSAIYYEKELDNLAESIFENYKKDVDTLISGACGDVLQQIPSVVNRLSEGEEESVSQALTTVRRIIDSFADTLFPASEETYDIGGNKLSLDASKHLNRLNVFVHQRVESKSRKDKIRQNLSNLYARVSTGVHADVSIEEAQSLFLNCYLLLGEILHISKLKKL